MEDAVTKKLLNKVVNGEISLADFNKSLECLIAKRNIDAKKDKDK